MPWKLDLDMYCSMMQSCLTWTPQLSNLSIIALAFLASYRVDQQSRRHARPNANYGERPQRKGTQSTHGQQYWHAQRRLGCRKVANLVQRRVKVSIHRRGIHRSKLCGQLSLDHCLKKSLDLHSRLSDNRSKKPQKRIQRRAQYIAKKVVHDHLDRTVITCDWTRIFGIGWNWVSNFDADCISLLYDKQENRIEILSAYADFTSIQSIVF